MTRRDEFIETLDFTRLRVIPGLKRERKRIGDDQGHLVNWNTLSTIARPVGICQVKSARLTQLSAMWALLALSLPLCISGTRPAAEPRTQSTTETSSTKPDGTPKPVLWAQGMRRRARPHHPRSGRAWVGETHATAEPASRPKRVPPRQAPAGAKADALRATTMRRQQVHSLFSEARPTRGPPGPGLPAGRRRAGLGPRQRPPGRGPPTRCPPTSPLGQQGTPRRQAPGPA